jgi:hypothetical protein
MSLPFDRPCIFCNGKYVKIKMGDENKNCEITTLIINEIGTNKIELGKSVIYHCERCGNAQSFLERLPNV